MINEKNFRRMYLLTPYCNYGDLGNSGNCGISAPNLIIRLEMLQKTFERKVLCKAHRILFCKIILGLLVDQESLLPL